MPLSRCLSDETFGEQIERSRMPKGPQGQQRPADLIGCAVGVMQIATGEVEAELTMLSGYRRSGYAGAKARVENTAEQECATIARTVAVARWGGR